MENVKNHVWADGNKIYFFSDFDEEPVNYLIRLIEKNSGKKNLTIVLKSYGGRVDEFRALVSLVKEYGIRVHVIGYAMSAGFYLWCAAPYRTMDESAKLMYHEMNFGASRKNLKDHEIDIEENKKEQDWLDSIVVATGGFTKEELDEIKNSRKSDYYMLYEDVLERNMLTESNDKNKNSGISTVEVIEDGE